MIAIIDYGSGNVNAIMNIMKQLKVECVLTGDPAVLAKADKFVLPGVGAFDPTMQHLNETGIVSLLNEQVLVKKKKVLGICVGMQLLAEASDEGDLPGLGWVKGRVRKISVAKLNRPPHLPHMGWNSIEPQNQATLFSDIDTKQGFYFLHSYYFDVAIENDVAARVEYGEKMPCAVERDNVFGMQFHPEKSHSNGMTIFRNFAGLA